MRTILLLAALALAGPPLAGCDGADDGPGAGPPTLLARPSAWRLVPSESVGAGPSTLRFEEGGFNAHVVCNLHFGAVTFPEAGRGLIRFDVQGATRAYCGAEGSAHEARFARTFAAVRSYAVDGDVLTLLGNGVRLRFNRVETVAL